MQILSLGQQSMTCSEQSSVLALGVHVPQLRTRARLPASVLEAEITCDTDMSTSAKPC